MLVLFLFVLLAMELILNSQFTYFLIHVVIKNNTNIQTLLLRSLIFFLTQLKNDVNIQLKIDNKNCFIFFSDGFGFPIWIMVNIFRSAISSSRP